MNIIMYLLCIGGSENDLLTPTQASSDDLTAPYYVSNSQQNVVDSRKSLPIVGGNQALIVGRNLNGKFHVQ